ncbi:unnamed protein product [Gordionus sp. m RMFG-2023]
MIPTPKPGGRNGPNKAVVKICSWNVRGVNNSLRLLDLVFEAQRQGVSVLCLQETYIEGNQVAEAWGWFSGLDPSPEQNFFGDYTFKRLRSDFI